MSPEISIKHSKEDKAKSAYVYIYIMHKYVVGLRIRTERTYVCINTYARRSTEFMHKN